MSEVQRRDVLIAMSLAAASLAEAQPAEAGDPSFMNNVPDPIDSGTELPTFKFALEKSQGKVIGNSFGKEATVTQLPISNGIAGVSMRLEPGAMRGSHGRFRVETLEQGDVGYIPQGYGHSIENVGDTPSRVLIGFNSGTYEAIDLSQWIAGNPADVLATNFAQSSELFAKFPNHDVFLAGRK